MSAAERLKTWLPNEIQIGDVYPFSEEGVFTDGPFKDKIAHSYPKEHSQVGRLLAARIDHFERTVVLDRDFESSVAEVSDVHDWKYVDTTKVSYKDKTPLQKDWFRVKVGAAMVTACGIAYAVSKR